jgi:hypothetical protein
MRSATAAATIGVMDAMKVFSPTGKRFATNQRSALAKRRPRWASRSRQGVLAACVAALALCAAPAAHAGVALNTIDDLATYRDEGALVRATGPIGCTRGERITITARISQATTGAVARGSWTGRCTGEVQHWKVRARTRTDVRFAEGTATVRAVAKTRAARRVTDTRRWRRRVSVSARF